MGGMLFEDKGKGIYIAHLKYFDEGLSENYALKGFAEKLEISFQPETKNFIVNLENVDRFNSSDIGEIMAVYQFLRENEVDMYVCGQGQPMKVLELTGLIKLDIKFKESLEAAVEEITRQYEKVH